MSSTVPTSRERLFLRALAAPNPSNQPGEQNWWSARELRVTALFPDLRDTPESGLAGFGKSCVRKGMAATRHIGPRGHGWSEWRVTSYGRGLVADSCIGGGLKWQRTPDGPACPACHARAIDLGVFGPFSEIPAHPLPGYLPAGREEAG